MYGNDHVERLREEFPRVLGKARISVGKGWEDVVRDCSARLAEADDSVEAAAVKEKFGSLRYQVGPPLVGGDGDWKEPEDWDTVREIIAEAESRSEEVCERCGTTKNVRTAATRYWIKTFCDPCRLERWEERPDDDEPDIIQDIKDAKV